MFNIEDMKKHLDSMKEIYNKESGAKTLLEKDKEFETKKLDEYIKECELFDKKKILINEACVEARKLSRDLFCSLSTHGLKHVLGTNLSVNIELGELGEKATADFFVKSKYDDYEVEVDPTEEEGGGVADIVALASFFNLGNFQKTKNGAPFFLDEPTKYVSKGHSKDVSKFIKAISKEMNKQIIMVTHDLVSKEIADKAYNLKLDDGGTSIAEDISVYKEEEE